MTFKEWFDGEMKAQGLTSRGLLFDRIKRVSKVSVTTQQKVYSGGKLGNYEKAKALSAATNSKVDIDQIFQF